MIIPLDDDPCKTMTFSLTFSLLAVMSGRPGPVPEPPPARDGLAPKLREKSNKLKQLDLFYREDKEGNEGGRKEEKPEDCVPDLPGNKEVSLVIQLLLF